MINYQSKIVPYLSEGMFECPVHRTDCTEFYHDPSDPRGGPGYHLTSCEGRTNHSPFDHPLRRPHPHN